MKTQDSSERFIPLTPIASDGPVLFIDSHAPLLDLHACASERLLTILNYLNLMTCTTLRDSSDKDIGTVTNTARLLLQDVQDVLAVIEMRAFST
ncbi:fructose-bisphosphate aldolase [Pseudomonas chlororaphis subsp. piscium]|nr:fructose-bisphosphate aldolase [Pseudomonas chlororaphis subsp. piscium]